MRRVVVTGLGAITPLGVGMSLYYYTSQFQFHWALTILAGIRHTWKRLLAGDCGIINILDRDERYAQLPCQIAATVPAGKRVDGGWDPSEWLAPGVRSLLFPWEACSMGGEGREDWSEGEVNADDGVGRGR